MSPKSTVYNFAIEISDVDRAVYQHLKLPVALHPSESLNFMVMRVLALALELEEGIAFSPGIGAPDEPTISVRGLDGALRTWIEIGAPVAERLNKAAKAAQRVAVYCHRSADVVHAQLAGAKIFRAEEVCFYSFDEAFITQLAQAVQKRNELDISRSDQALYVTINGKSVSSPIVERRLV